MSQSRAAGIDNRDAIRMIGASEPTKQSKNDLRTPIDLDYSPRPRHHYPGVTRGKTFDVDVD